MGVLASRAHQTSSLWAHWCSFCVSLNLVKMLTSLEDHIPVLQLYGRCYHMGEMSPSCHPVHSHTVEGALHAMGQTMAGMGQSNPCLNLSGDIDFHIQQQLATYAKQDPPPW